ncbi:MAG TPA: flagellar biosynthetic protein FliO [candidate division Zixibacteria bacterium]|nr:flagellar biosynthetic protein FliO [candidate division Zixibacteria bacterium]
MFTSRNFSFSRVPLAAGIDAAPAAWRAAAGAWRMMVRRIGRALGGRPPAAAELEHVATLALTAQSALVLVRLGGETLLLGATPHRIAVLSRRHDREAPAVGGKEAAS